LHRLAYVSALAGVLHYYLLVKADTRQPLAFAAVLVVLLAYRIFNKYVPGLRRGRGKVVAAT
jgi:sulfoxide reductase heme-binding subunit YedZ